MIEVDNCNDCKFKELCKNTKGVDNAYGGLECSAIWKNQGQGSSQVDTFVIRRLIEKWNNEDTELARQIAKDFSTNNPLYAFNFKVLEHREKRIRKLEELIEGV